MKLRTFLLKFVIIKTLVGEVQEQECPFNEFILHDAKMPKIIEKQLR